MLAPMARPRAKDFQKATENQFVASYY